MQKQAVTTAIDGNAAQVIEPSLADQLIQEAQEGSFTPQIGTARWANPILAAQAYSYEPGAIWLGRNPVNASQSMGYKDDRHVLVCAGTRTGKGRTMIVNNLALWPGSICAIDPKGENATILANRRDSGSEYCDGLGQDVFVFDPFHCAQVADNQRAYFDPLSTLEADDPALPRKVGRLAEATTIIPEGESAEWAKRGRQMIATIILHVITSDRFDGEDERGRKYRSFVTVRRLITAGDTRAYEQLKEMGADSIPPAMELLWDAIAHNHACDGIISDQGESNFQSLKHHREYFESVRKSAAENTDWVDDPQMRQTLIGGAKAAKEFKPQTLKSSTVGQSIFLCLPVDDMAVYGRWQRVMIATVISEMQKSQGLPANNHPLLMCLDEFPALGTMERLEKAAAEIAGAGVKLMTVVQNLPQLQKLYKKGWETFLGNSGLQIFFGMDDNTTRGYLEKALGEMEIIKRIRTENRGVSEQFTEGETKGHSEGTTTGRSTGGNETWQDSQGQNKTWQDSQGQNTTWQDSQGQNKTWQDSQGQNKTWQKSHGQNTSKQDSSGGNTSWGSSNSTGTNWNSGQSGGTSNGANYAPFLFFKNYQGSSEGSNQGWNSGQGGNTSQSSTNGAGENWSRSSGTGENWSKSHGGGVNSSRSQGGGVNSSRSQGGGENSSRSQGGGENSSRSQGGGVNWSDTTGTSHQTNYSEQNSASRGSQSGESIAESVHKKPLLASNEADKLFALISDKDHIIYPGLALVKISGQDAMFVRKTNYDEDHAFVRCFDPSPAYPFVAIEEIPDDLPTPIEIPPTLERKNFLREKFPKKKDALLKYSSVYDGVDERPDEGIYWESSTQFFVEHPIKFTWDILIQTQYMGQWHPFYHPGEGRELPDEFDVGARVAHNNHPCYLVWCKPRDKLILRTDASAFFEMSLKETSTAGRTLITARFFRFNEVATKIGYKLLFAFSKVFLKKSTEKWIEEKSNSMDWALKYIASRFKNIVDETAVLGLPVDESDGDRRDSIHRWLHNRTGTLYFFKDEFGVPIIQSGRSYPKGMRYAYVVPNDTDEDHAYFQENDYLEIELDDHFIFHFFKEEGDVVQNQDNILVYRKTAGLTPNEMYNTALNYANGVGVEQNYVQAAAWYSKAAEHDHPAAIDNLACLYQYGNGVSKKERLAFNLFKRSSELGSLFAIENIAFCYRNGIGTKIDLDKFIHFTKIGSSKSSTYSWLMTGDAYRQGLGVNKSTALALKYYRKSFDHISFDFQCYIAVYINDVLLLATFKSMEGAKHNNFIRKYTDYSVEIHKNIYESEKKSDWWQYGISIFNYGCYRSSLDTIMGSKENKNNEDAIRIFKENIDENCCAKSMIALAEHYSAGIGLQKNVPSAIELLKRASQILPLSANCKLVRVLTDNKEWHQLHEPIRQLLDCASSETVAEEVNLAFATIELAIHHLEVNVPLEYQNAIKEWKYELTVLYEHD